ncbi:indole-3-acetic acid-induced protein [Salix suchowensis]|nr:indole-3-acetic acid-induced protein [Salix suchowensis]
MHPFLISHDESLNTSLDDPSNSQGTHSTYKFCPSSTRNQFYYSNHSFPDMGILSFPSVAHDAKKILKYNSNVPKRHIAVYVGELQKKRFVEDFGFNHPMGGLTIPCKEDSFIDLACRLHDS